MPLFLPFLAGAGSLALRGGSYLTGTGFINGLVVDTDKLFEFTDNIDAIGNNLQRKLIGKSTLAGNMVYDLGQFYIKEYVDFGSLIGNYVKTRITDPNNFVNDLKSIPSWPKIIVEEIKTQSDLIDTKQTNNYLAGLDSEMNKRITKYVNENSNNPNSFLGKRIKQIQQHQISNPDSILNKGTDLGQNLISTIYHEWTDEITNPETSVSSENVGLRRITRDTKTNSPVTYVPSTNVSPIPIIMDTKNSMPLTGVALAKNNSPVTGVALFNNPNNYNTADYNNSINKVNLTDYFEDGKFPTLKPKSTIQQRK